MLARSWQTVCEIGELLDTRARIIPKAIRVFLSRQVSQIKEGGGPAVRRKVRTAVIETAKLPFQMLGVLLAIPVVLVVRIIRPIKLVRFGALRSDLIGHMVFDSEYYLSERETLEEHSLDLFYFQTRLVPNSFYPEMLRRHFRISPIYRYMDKLNRMIPNGELHHKVPCTTNSRDIQGYLTRTKTHISFTKQEDRSGASFLKTVGMGLDDRFVCLLVRDSVYKTARSKDLGQQKDWTYHEYRDSDIDTYSQAALALAERGYWIFRMGKRVHKPFKVDHPRILDYANSEYRSDFLDIWLMANCFFCISTGTGLDEVSRVFRRPAVKVNYLPIQHISSYSADVTAPKRLYWIGSGQELTLTEHLRANYLSSQQYQDAGIGIKDLDSGEILSAVWEMISREEGWWPSGKDSIDRQNQFWKIMQSSPEWTTYHGVVHPKAYVSDYFIKKNSLWLQ